jgi:hypothetical protein
MRHKQIDEIYECIKYNTGSYDDDARSCAEILYDYLGYRKSEWISVKDRLPEIDTYVLAYSTKYERVDVYYYARENEWWDYEGWASAIYFGITHWMPIPAPPTEKEN